MLAFKLVGDKGFLIGTMSIQNSTFHGNPLKSDQLAHVFYLKYFTFFRYNCQRVLFFSSPVDFAVQTFSLRCAGIFPLQIGAGKPLPQSHTMTKPSLFNVFLLSTGAIIE